MRIIGRSMRHMGDFAFSQYNNVVHIDYSFNGLVGTSYQYYLFHDYEGYYDWVMGTEEVVASYNHLIRMQLGRRLFWEI